MTVPTIDISIGMDVYSTDIHGIAGSIKRTANQFIVEEVLDNTFDLAKKSDGDHEYPLYLLHKEGIDSAHAIKEIEIATGLKFKAVGLKDANAVTTQYISSIRKQRDAKNHVTTSHCSLELVGYTRKPLTKGKLAGNRFEIIITDFINDNVENSISKLQHVLDKNRIANFYGYQRFGSSRAVTHLVGREIVKRNFKKAVELFLCHPGKNDDEETRSMREACRDGKFSEVLKIMPSQMDLERILIQELVNSNDPAKALRKLPITIRRLLVQAYQSYLFNKSLSKVVKDGYDIGSANNGDVCFYVKNDNIVTMKRYDANADTIQLPAIPLVGFAFRDDNRFGSIVRSVMEEENVSKNDFYIKEMQEVSVEGGFRQASLSCKQFSYIKDKSLKLNFFLHKGCYATVLLRELMKPVDPINAGF